MLPLRQFSHVCRLGRASVPYIASPVSVGFTLDSSLRDSAHHNCLEVPGSVLVPVPGGGTKQLCMFHHLGWFGMQQICLVGYCSALAATSRFFLSHAPWSAYRCRSRVRRDERLKEDKEDAVQQIGAR